jgi:hypothetical protein
MQFFTGVLNRITQEDGSLPGEPLGLFLGILYFVIIPTALNRRIGYQNIIKSIMDIFPPGNIHDLDPFLKYVNCFDGNNVR